MNNIFKKLAGNTLIFAVGNAATLLISFFMVPVYTSILSTSEFGVSDLINTTVNMLLPVISLNIFAAVFRWAIEENDNRIEIFSNGIFISCLGSILSILFGVLLSIFKVKYAWVIGFNLGGVILLNHFQNFARGIEQTKLYSFSGIVASAINLSSNLLLMIIFKLGLNGYLISLVISNYSATMFLFVFGKYYQYWNKNAISKDEIKKMLKFSLPMIPNAFTWWMTNDASRLIILIFVGAAGNGLFAVANKIPSLISTLFGLFQNAWQISAVETYKNKSANNIYSLTFNIVFGVILIGCIFVISIIKIFMKFYVAPDFFKAWEFIPILLLTAVFSSVSAFLGTTYLVAKKTKGLFTTTIWGTIINIALSSMLIPLFGVNGAGISGMLGFFVVSLMRLRQTEKWVKININWSLHLPLIVGYILMSIIAYTNDRLIYLKVIIVLVEVLVLGLYIKRNRFKLNSVSEVQE
ncbi:lipopolysaccharide biosynthesis protein [Lactococcus lactis]|uniref:lipopolysaccharide biosynthesis protein n=1 Tax=Lactococcus lactis TaxID=1358 RepID=UPI00207417B0|nr:polysaccharide biosynthesis C-terminal domain-containing protein [Lactococcus lactis]